MIKLDELQSVVTDETNQPWRSFPASASKAGGTIDGNPTLPQVKVTGEVLGEVKGPKITIFKHKRRKDYRRTKGHRQQVTVLRITDILTDGKKSAKKAAAKKPAAEDEAKPAAKTEDKPAAKPAAKKPAAKKPAAKKPAAKKTAAKKPAAKKPAAKKRPATKPASKETEE